MVSCATVVSLPCAQIKSSAGPETEMVCVGGVQVEPSVHVAPFTVVEGFTSPEFPSELFDTFDRLPTVGFG
jgi:hypothetical protein